MANPYPMALRERAVRAYETSTDTYREVADRFEIHFNTLVRWVQRGRDRGDLLPSARGGGWRSPVQIDVVHRLVAEWPDRTTDELTRAYNAAVEAPARVHRSSILRALQRTGYVFKKNGRDRSSRIVRASRRSGTPSAAGSLV
jgi:transposase